MRKLKTAIVILLIISVMVAIGLLVKTNSVNALAQEIDNLQGDTQQTGLGDLNGDGSVDSTDASYILKMEKEIFNNTYDERYSFQVADVDGDGNITSNDAQIVLMYSAGIGTGNISEMTLEEYVKELLGNE